MSELESVTDGYVEQNFRMGVVIRKFDDAAQCVWLHSQWLAREDDDFYGNVPKGAISSDVGEHGMLSDYIDVHERGLQRPFEMPDGTSIVGGGAFSVISPSSVGDIWGQIQEGSVLHEHTGRQLMSSGAFSAGTVECYQDETEYCIGPTVLDIAGMYAAIVAAKHVADERTRQHIVILEAAERDLLQQYEVIDLTKPIRLFDGIREVTDDDGRVGLVVPTRVVIHPRFGIQLLNVQLYHQPNMGGTDGDTDWTGQLLRFASGGYIWAPYVLPLESVDARGVPLDTNATWKRVHINLSNPYRSLQGDSGGIEEEKVIIDCAGQGWVAEFDREYAVGGQGFGGVAFTEFCNTHGNATYHEFGGFEGYEVQAPSTIQQKIATPMLVRTDDLDALQEIEIRLPGFEE